MLSAVDDDDAAAASSPDAFLPQPARHTRSTAISNGSPNFYVRLKPNSITAPNMFGASSELASVMEFGFYTRCRWSMQKNPAILLVHEVPSISPGSVATSCGTGISIEIYLTSDCSLIWALSHISGAAKVTVVKFCTWVGYIKC